MGMIKYPYELSVWKEELNGTNKKIESKGVIIGAHDMNYLGKATSINLTRKLNGTNVLVFSMPDRYFDSLTGEFVRNELIDVLSPESKIKFHYKNRWYEFFIKKVDEKKVFKSYIKTFTCTDAFIDELSRNGYGIIFDTELNNNVEELGTFTEEVLEDSIWTYAPQYNWGDFTEFKEEKLFKIPVSQFKNLIGYKLNFGLSNKQLKSFDDQEITNVSTGDKRPIVLSDDIARNCFWDQRDDQRKTPDNQLKQNLITDIPNDGYIYVPYSCLNFCYGADEPNNEKIKYDRAATEIALNYPNTEKLAIAPPSVDPRTLIQFYAIPADAPIELDDAGVILDTDYCYFMTLRQWNENVVDDNWYFFEDTRLVSAEVLGSVDLKDATISHTYRYIKNDNSVLDTAKEALGNKCLTYNGYLSDINDTNIIKGKKFSITNRTEVNISEDIDQYVTVYNNHADEFIGEYTSDTWEYSTSDSVPYKVCSKLETRQIIPQLARNLIQNGIKMDSEDGWAPMSYIALEDRLVQNPSFKLRTIKYDSEENNDDIIDDTALLYASSRSAVGYQYRYVPKKIDNTDRYYTEENLVIKFNREQIVSYPFADNINYVFHQIFSGSLLIKMGKNFYLYGYQNREDGENNLPKYIFICENTTSNPIYKALLELGSIVRNNSEAETVWYEYPKKISSDEGETEKISYIVQEREWYYEEGQLKYTLKDRYEESSEDLSSACSIVNFGIVGQQKIIEKNKIYCIGIAAFAELNQDGAKEGAFEIYIGEGSLIQDGVYKIDENNSIKLDSTCFYPIGEVYNNQPNWEDLDILTDDISIEKMPEQRFIFLKSNITIQNPYFVIKTKKKMLIFELYLFECYTKGRDSFSDNSLKYRYSGRDLFWPVTSEIETYETKFKYSPFMSKEEASRYVIFEDDIMLGSTYTYQHYFIQRLKATKIIDKDERNQEQISYYDTCGKKSFINTKDFVDGELPLDESEYSMDDCEVETNYIDLNKCKYYNQNAGPEECDCSCGGEHLCFYQRFGYCPYRFETEKHDRRIRTLSVSKSNRFNIIQDESKVFEVYPQFYIQHNENGTVVQDENEQYLKQVYFIAEKGNENKIGFRYEKNLKDISRNITSENIVTKLYVLDVDSDLSKTGLCSIKTAEDNPSADSYIIDLSYYIEKGMLDEDEVQQDLYGIYPTLSNSEIPSGFLRQLGYYNKRYDELTNKIINLQDASFNELEANLQVNLQGIITAQEQILKAKKQIESYKQLYAAKGGTEASYKDQATYKNYLTKLHEQQATLSQLISETFFTSKKTDTRRSVYFSNEDQPYDGLIEKFSDTQQDFNTLVNVTNPLEFFELISDFNKIQKTWVDKHIYNAGILGQFNKEYLQIQQWKKERASYLKLINQISSAFYKKYEPYLKEGTWSDSNYLTDNAYYFGALDVAAQGAIPKVSYNISVIDVSQQNEEYESVYNFDLADSTYIEDIGMFGINKKTGFPNRLKVLVSEVSENPDDQSKNGVKVQNFTTQFEDLFQQVTASVQSLTFNENIYKRSSNFTSLQNISNDSLQGALDTNDLTLLDTDENNIKVDNNGTSGSDINNHANKYKLNGQGLYFSNDGGQHWSVGVGPKGINADYIKVGNLDAGKIRIADSSYVYFSWDKNGIVAYRDPAGINTNTNNINDMAIFNKYGLSIVNKGKIKLRAGYSYSVDQILNGDIDAEKFQESQIGFYLYNDIGIPIFSTTEVDGGARLALTGEIQVSDSNLTYNPEEQQKTTYVYENSYTSQVIQYYKLETDRGQTVTEHGTYDQYVNLNPSDQITIDGESYTVQSHIANFTYGMDYKTDIYKIKKHDLILLKDSDSSNKTISFCQGMSLNGTDYIPNNWYYFVTNDAVASTTFYKINNDHKAGVVEEQIGGAYYSAIYNELDIHIDSSTNSVFFKDAHLPGAHIVGYGDTDDNKIWTVERIRSGGSGTATPIALYLNKTDVKNNDLSGRIFSCVKQGTDKVENLFTILKGGALYIGGDVYEYINDSSNIRVPENIQNIGTRLFIRNPGIAVEEGVLKLDFSNVQDTQSTMNLREFVKNSVDQGTSGLIGHHDHYVSAYSDCVLHQNIDKTTITTVEELIDWINDQWIVAATRSDWRIGWAEYI